VWDTYPFRWVPTPCLVDPPEFYREDRFELISGGAYWNGRHTTFAGSNRGLITPEFDGSYQTIFGPYSPHSGQVYCKCAPCLNLATARLTVMKGPRAREEEYWNAQITAMSAPEVQAYATEIATATSDWLGTFMEARLHYRDPHDKLALRVAGMAELLEIGRDMNDTWTDDRRRGYKMKLYEVCKQGKMPRGIGDFGVMDSLQGAFLTKILKRKLEETPFEMEGLTARFCAKPTEASLTSAFLQLMDPTRHSTFIYFSDDSCYSIRTPTGVKYFNIDIKKCDTSHTPELFELLTTGLTDSALDTMRSLIKQCEQIITIVNPENKKQKVRLKPLRAVLFSGSTLTTYINDWACILISTALAKHKPTTAEDIKRAIATVGYEVTVSDAFDSPIHLQFLKHSPVRDTSGVWRPLLNPGVIFRASGRCKGDLPGRGDLRERAKAFQASLLRSFSPRASYPLLDAMRAAVATTTKLERDVSHHYNQMDWAVGTEMRHFTNEAVLERYGLTGAELVCLQEQAHAPVFTSVSSRGRAKVLHLDYSLLA